MLYDAHNHFHDARLAPHREAILQALEPLDLRGAVVNGTRESDWDAVAAVARQFPWVRPAFGLHPWYVKERSAGWLERLREKLEEFPEASVGEIGLDRWIKDYDLENQKEVFHAQLRLAAERGVPATIHCVQAWGALQESLRTNPLPARGFLIHAYAGPQEMVAGFAAKGAYFSFSPYFLHKRKAAQRAVFQALEPSRILAETDAPDLRPPDERNRHPLAGPEGEAINHPANLEVTYDGLAELRGTPRAELEASLAENFRRLFG